MEKKINDIERGITVYLNCTRRDHYATIRKIGSSMGFPVYIVEFYAFGIVEHSWAYKDLNTAIEALAKRCYKF